MLQYMCVCVCVWGGGDAFPYKTQVGMNVNQAMVLLSDDLTQPPLDE